MNNLGAQAASGEILIFLNDDTEPLSGSWLDRLIGHAQRPDVGVAGARLLYPSGTIQHAGIVVGIGDGCGHIGRGAVLAPYWPWLNLTRDVSAVTGACLAVRKEVFGELGGFDDLFPSNYNDADLCLRARQMGYRVVYDPAVVLTHYEAQSRRTTVTLKERQLWYRRWANLIDAGDPFYSRHLTQRLENLTLAE
jgi:GT2 family glycosyltransferase